VRRLEVIGSGEVGNQTTFSILNEHGTCSSGCTLILHVMNTYSIGGSTLLKLLSIRIIPNTSEVGSLSRLAICSQDPLSNTDRVLSSTTGNILWGVVVDKFFVNGEVFVLGEDGIVYLDVVFVEDVLADVGGNVEEGVTHAYDGACELGHS
jgi:hypothetical protein